MHMLEFLHVVKELERYGVAVLRRLLEPHTCLRIGTPTNPRTILLHDDVDVRFGALLLVERPMRKERGAMVLELARPQREVVDVGAGERGEVRSGDG